MALNLEVISPEGILFKGQCHMAVVPASTGEIGVMENHEVFVANLGEGNVRVFDEQQNQLHSFAVKSGFAKMQDLNNLLVLVS